MPRLNLLGKRFDRLVVIDTIVNSRTESGKKVDGPTWLCLCDCGNHVAKRASDLMRQKWLGCKKCESITRAQTHLKHGDARGGIGGKTRLYNVWKGMWQRCSDPSHVGWKLYGGRGITICQGWTDFSAFRTWAESSGYAHGLTIDRRDSDGDYSPDNCEWITRSENGRRAMDKRWGRTRLRIVGN